MNSFWSQRKPREKALIVICALAAVVGIPLALIPIAGPKGKLLPYAEAHRKYESALKEKLSLEDNTGRLRPALAKMTYDSPPEALIPKVIRALQDQAKKYGIHLREVKPLRARRIAAVTKVPISVRFTASFVQSVPFLYGIEDPSERLAVEKIAIITPDPKSRTVDIELQVVLFTTGTAVGTEI